MRYADNSECYAICSHIESGFFDNERAITIGNVPGELIISLCSLAKTKDGFDAVKFHIHRIENGLASGIVYNCENACLGYRLVPVDSLALESEVMPILR